MVQISNLNKFLQDVKESRTKSAITQEEMARKLGYKQRLSYLKLENGQSDMSLPQAMIICDILGLDLSNYQ